MVGTPIVYSQQQTEEWKTCLTQYTNFQFDILKEEYESQYVAIKDRKLLDNDYDLERLVETQHQEL